MKSFLFPAMLLMVCSLLAGCANTNTVVPAGTGTTPATTTPVSATNPAAMFDPTGQTLVTKGTFANGAHTVKGTVTVYEKGGKRTLVFADFQTDGGPDLRIYVAEDRALTNSIEITKLTASGNFIVDLPTNFDPTRHRTVVIWCKAFSVLFGSALLN